MNATTATRTFSIKNHLVAIGMTLSLGFTGNVCAESATPVQAGQVAHMQTRGVDAYYYSVWRQDAVATVVLLSGGGGGFGHIDEAGWPSSHNFLVRSAPLFASKKLNVVVYGKAEDLDTLDFPDRVGEPHMADLKVLLTTLKIKSPVPIWLAGTSRGTISGTEATIRYQGDLVSGLILTASATLVKTPNVLTQNLKAIKVPVLIVHHASDPCKASPASMTRTIEDRLSGTSAKKVVLISGGDASTGDNCGNTSYHGFPGKEQEVVDLSADWISAHPTAAAK